jgi:hypothetical protein
MSLWRSIVVWFASFAADPVTVAEEDYRCQAAVAAAYASMATDGENVPPSPPQPPAPVKKCSCNGTKIIKPDGTIPQPCFCGENCKCKPGGN